MTDRELLELIATQVGVLTNNVDELRNYVSGIKNDVDELKSDVSGLKNDVDELRNDVSGLKNDMLGIKNDVDELKSDMSGMRESQRNFETELGSVKKIVLDIEENHGNKLSTLEIKIDNLDNKLDDSEANNAERHLSLNGDIGRIKSGLSKIEIITADNWGDIARLKARKNHKIR